SWTSCWPKAEDYRGQARSALPKQQTAAALAARISAPRRSRAQQDRQAPAPDDLHPEDAVADVFDGRVSRCREPEREDRARVQRIDDAVVPKARGRVVRRS